MSDVAEIDRVTLHDRLARGDALKLIMASSNFAFRAKHIPGSLHFASDADLFAALGEDDDVVVYCSNIDCNASLKLIRKLRERGYRKVTHYGGGLIDWEDGGLALEGDWATE